MRISKELQQKDSALLAVHSLEVKLHPLPYPLPYNEDYVQSNKVKKCATESSVWPHLVPPLNSH